MLETHRTIRGMIEGDGGTAKEEQEKATGIFKSVMQIKV